MRSKGHVSPQVLTHSPQLGLSLGSIPFILRSKLSYSQLGVFALSAYPYSLKLLWSPIVDSQFVPSIGRRKSWIMPMQIVIGCTMLWIALNVQDLIDNVRGELRRHLRGWLEILRGGLTPLCYSSSAGRACRVPHVHLYIPRILLGDSRYRR